MTARLFVDTNVLVYARDVSAGDKQTVAAAWMQHLWAEKAGRLSTQVLQEFYVTATMKLSPGLDVEAAREEVRTLFAWDPVTVGERVIEGAWRFMGGSALSFWDALIVAAAEVADCPYLLTEDLQPGQQFGSVTVVDPFTTTPTELA